jgi:hypothetical protein
MAIFANHGFLVRIGTDRDAWIAHRRQASHASSWQNPRASSIRVAAIASPFPSQLISFGPIEVSFAAFLLSSGPFSRAFPDVRNHRGRIGGTIGAAKLGDPSLEISIGP